MSIRRLLNFIFLYSISSISTIGFSQIKSYSLTEGLNHYETKYNIRFAYPSDILDKEIIYFNPDSVNLWMFLKGLRDKRGIEYLVVNNQEVLLRKSLLQAAPIHAKVYELKVVDSQNNLPLELVAIGISGTSNGGYTNSNGELKLSIPQNQLESKLQLSLLGYENKTISLLELSKDGVINLAQSNFSIQEILIEERIALVYSNIENQSIIIRPKDQSSFTSGVVGRDIMRSIQLLPGITAHNDKSSKLQIRGGDDDETLILLDGIPVYNASHYYGIFSAINPSFTNDLALFKNNLPIEYGGKTSGMLKINSKSLNGETKAGGQIDLNLLSSSAMFVIPINSHFGIVAAGRTTFSNVSNTDFFDLFNDPADVSSTVQNFSALSRDALLSRTPDFRFSDYNARLVYQDKKTSADLNYYTSRDRFDDNFNNEFKARRLTGVVLFKEAYQNIENWKNMGWSINGSTVFTNKISLQSTLFSSLYNNENIVSTSIERTSADGTDKLGFSNQRNNQISNIGFKTSVSYYPTKYQTVQVGLDIQDYKTELDISEEQRNIKTSNQNAKEYSIFGSYIKEFASGGFVQFGLRNSYYNLSKTYYLAPRLSLVYPLNLALNAKASIGWHNQFVRELSYENIFGRTVNIWTSGAENGIPISESKNLMIGVNWKKNRFSIDAEFYFKETEGEVEFALVNPSFNQNSILPISQRLLNQYKLFVGSGKVIGADLLMNYSSVDYSGSLSYTLSKSTVSFNNILRGVDFPAKDDRGHQVKWSNEFYTGKFSISGNVIYASGRAYTDLTALDNGGQRDKISPEERISRLPHYARIDIGVSYKLKFGQSSANIGLSIYNALDRQNVNYLQYIFSIPNVEQNNQKKLINTIIGTQTNLIGRTFNLNLSFSF